MPLFFSRFVPPRFGTAEVGSEEDSEDDMRALWEAAPVIASGLGFTYEINPIPSAILHDTQMRPARPGE